jgi:hypothetical protein
MKQSFTEKYNGKKVSDIFKEYVAPLLELYFDGVGDFNAAELEQILQLPWLVWNSMIMQHDVKNKIDYYTSINLLLRNQPDAQKVVDAMRQRKKLMFEQYDFLFGNYKINFDPATSTVSLWAEARTPS